MGGIYALCGKEPDAGSEAVREHYLPGHSGGSLPKSLSGAVLSIADKIDSICGCFSIGFEPTGKSDPYALRRQGTGIVRIMKEREFSFKLEDLILEGLSHFVDKKIEKAGSNETVERLRLFLKNRVKYLLAGEGFSKDVTNAVTSISSDCIPETWKRAKALEKIKLKPDFEPLAITFKRVVNIIKKADPTCFKDCRVDAGLFEHDCESALLNAYEKVSAKIHKKKEKGCYYEALLDAASLRKEVDDYFDGAMVMAEDIDLRANRLSLLKKLADLFSLFADFSKLSI